MKRSDRKGAPINVEIYPASNTNAPIVRVEWRLLGDGEPPVVTGFPEPRGHPAGDWFYNRGLFIKPTMNGDFFAEVRAFDANGCEGVGRSSTRIHVFQ